jgi:hypothetical protein
MSMEGVLDHMHKEEETSMWWVNNEKLPNLPKSNFKSLANQLDIHLIWQNKKDWSLTIWQTNLAKIETWQNSHPHVYICAHGSWLHRRFPVGGRVKKEINNRERFLMLFKSWKGIVDAKSAPHVNHTASRNELF